MTYLDLVRQYLPGVTDREAEHILWERTPFPVVQGEDDLRPYLEKERKRHEHFARRLTPAIED